MVLYANEVKHIFVLQIAGLNEPASEIISLVWRVKRNTFGSIVPPMSLDDDVTDNDFIYKST